MLDGDREAGFTVDDERGLVTMRWIEPDPTAISYTADSDGDPDEFEQNF